MGGRGLIATLALALATSAVPGAAVAQTGVDEDAAAMMPIDGKRVALVIGNGDYDETAGWTDLENAANDAAHIARALASSTDPNQRFEVELVRNGTMAQLRAALTTFAERARTADIAVIYFSGHGFEYNLDNYIVPVDAVGMIDDGQVGARYINMADVVKAAGTRGFSLFFLDACRDPGPVIRTSNDTSGHRAAQFGAINAPQSAVFYSTALGDVAYDDAPPGSPLSPFAAAVGKAMTVPGLDVPYLFTRVRESVLRATGNRDPRQIPQLAGSWSRPFYFVPPQKLAAAIPGGAAPATDLAPLQIPLATLSTLDEPILLSRVLEDHKPADIQRRAQAGDALSQYLLGYMLEFGVGVAADIDGARNWLEQAAASGHPAGQLELGYFLLRHGTPADKPRALELYRRASDQGFAKAKSHLGVELLDGPYNPPRWAQGIALLKEAAAGGHAYAMEALAQLGEDRPRYMAELTALAAAGNVEGDNWLCELAQNGHMVDKVFDHCIAAAKQGYANARAITALRLEKSLNVAASPEGARYWARLALSAPDLRPELKTRISPLAAN